MTFNPDEPCGCVAHYTTAAKALLGILPTRSLKLGTYRYMRDPTESKDLLPRFGWRGFRPDHSDDAAVWDRVVTKLLDARKNARVLSVTTETPETPGAIERRRAFDCAWFRPRMWEQYGDDHRGVCLLFYEEALVREARQQASEIHIGRVRYSKRGVADLPMLRDESLFVQDEQAQDEALDRFLRQHVHDYFFQKLTDYEAESELRMVALPGSTIGTLKTANPHAYLRYGDALAGIVLGHQFSVDYLNAAFNVAADAGVPLFSIEWLDGRPELHSFE